MLGPEAKITRRKLVLSVHKQGVATALAGLAAGVGVAKVMDPYHP